MQLLITKNKTFIELPDAVKMKANDFGVWFWENFFNIDGVRVENPNVDDYAIVYEDFKSPKVRETKRTLF